MAQAIAGTALKDYEWQITGEFDIDQDTTLQDPKFKVIGVNYRTESRQFMMEIAFYEVMSRHVRAIVQTLPEGDESIDAEKIIGLVGLLYPTAVLTNQAEAQ